MYIHKTHARTIHYNYGNINKEKLLHLRFAEKLCLSKTKFFLKKSNLQFIELINHNIQFIDVGSFEFDASDVPVRGTGKFP